MFILCFQYNRYYAIQIDHDDKENAFYRVEVCISFSNAIDNYDRQSPAGLTVRALTLCTVGFGFNPC